MSRRVSSRLHECTSRTSAAVVVSRSAILAAAVVTLAAAQAQADRFYTEPFERTYTGTSVGGDGAVETCTASTEGIITVRVNAPVARDGSHHAACSAGAGSKVLGPYVDATIHVEDALIETDMYDEDQRPSIRPCLAVFRGASNQADLIRCADGPGQGLPKSYWFDDGSFPGYPTPGLPASESASDETWNVHAYIGGAATVIPFLRAYVDARSNGPVEVPGRYARAAADATVVEIRSYEIECDQGCH